MKFGCRYNDFPWLGFEPPIWGFPYKAKLVQIRGPVLFRGMRAIQPWPQSEFIIRFVVVLNAGFLVTDEKLSL